MTRSDYDHKEQKFFFLLLLFFYFTFPSQFPFHINNYIISNKVISKKSNVSSLAMCLVCKKRHRNGGSKGNTRLITTKTHKRILLTLTVYKLLHFICMICFPSENLSPLPQHLLITQYPFIPLFQNTIFKHCAVLLVFCCTIHLPT